MQRCYQSDPATRLKKLYNLESEDGYVKKADWYKLYEEAYVIPGGGS